MNTNRRRLPLVLVSFYAWISAVFFGITFLDIKYSRALKDVVEGSNEPVIFSEISDLLLLLGALAVLAALVAIAFSWNLAAARNLLIASLIILSLEFLIPVLFSRMIQDAQFADLGPWLRMLPIGAASLLAFIALGGLSRGK
jgi:hypothetical protein